VALIAVWNNRPDHKLVGERVMGNMHQPGNQHIFIALHWTMRMWLFFMEVQIGAVGHRKRGYPVYPVSNPFFYTPVVSCLYAGIFRRYLVDVDHLSFHPQK